MKLFAILFAFVMMCFVASCTNLNNHKNDTSDSGTCIIAYVYPSNRVISPDEIDVTRLTHINYAFANIIDGQIVEGYPDVDALNMAMLVGKKEINPELQILISVGGWTWSGNFSDMALTAESRGRFIQSAMSFIQQHKLDGLDLDWEYPGLPGNNNVHRYEDRKNFTALLRECRQALDSLGGNDKKYLLTIAAGAFEDYLEYTEMHLVAKYLDMVNVMTYDFTGEWSGTTGHHTNLDGHERNQNSVKYAANLFLNAGVPIDKLVIGAGLYGRGWHDVSPVNNGLHQTGKGLSGHNLNYYNLVENYLTNSDFQSFWDEDAQAPYLWNANERIFITYENPTSVRGKAKYVKESSIRGMMYWQYFGDNDNELLEEIYRALLKTP